MPKHAECLCGNGGVGDTSKQIYGIPRTFQAPISLVWALDVYLVHRNVSAVQTRRFWTSTMRQKAAKFLFPVQSGRLLFWGKLKGKAFLLDKFHRNLVLRTLHIQALLFKKNLDLHLPPFMVISECRQTDRLLKAHRTSRRRCPLW